MNLSASGAASLQVSDWEVGTIASAVFAILCINLIYKCYCRFEGLRSFRIHFPHPSVLPAPPTPRPLRSPEVDVFRGRGGGVF
jgi:hypothetical protein